MVANIGYLQQNLIMTFPSDNNSKRVTNFTQLFIVFLKEKVRACFGFIR